MVPGMENSPPEDVCRQCSKGNPVLYDPQKVTIFGVLWHKGKDWKDLNMGIVTFVTEIILYKSMN